MQTHSGSLPELKASGKKPLLNVKQLADLFLHFRDKRLGLWHAFSMKQEILSEADILVDVMQLRRSKKMTREFAEWILDWEFSDRIKSRMAGLASKNNAGTITDSELKELDRYVGVGTSVDILQAKARAFLDDSPNRR